MIEPSLNFRPVAQDGVNHWFCFYSKITTMALKISKPLPFGKHKEPTKRSQGCISNCGLHKKCEKSQMLYYIAMTGNSKPHKCPSLRCKICKVALTCNCMDETEVHWCYMQVLPAEKENTNMLVYYDFETFVNKNGVHVLFLVCRCVRLC